jgi:uridine kinase
VRPALITRLRDLIMSRRPSHVLRVAVDGPDAAGKTTLAAELAQALAGARETILASVDGFHRPRQLRLRYYEDAFDYPAVRTSLLEPLGPEGDRCYRTAVFDYRTDSVVDEPVRQAANGAVLLFDGVFLLRPELRGFWDLSIFLDVSPEETLRRALVRDAELFGDAVRARYRLRYLPAQRHYRAAAEPAERADVVIDNEDPARPRVLKWPAG